MEGTGGVWTPCLSIQGWLRVIGSWMVSGVRWRPARVPMYRAPLGKSAPLCQPIPRSAIFVSLLGDLHTLRGGLNGYLYKRHFVGTHHPPRPPALLSRHQAIQLPKNIDRTHPTMSAPLDSSRNSVNGTAFNVPFEEDGYIKTEEERGELGKRAAEDEIHAPTGPRKFQHACAFFLFPVIPVDSR